MTGDSEKPQEYAYCGHPLSPPETGYWCRKCGIWIDETPGEREKYVLTRSPLYTEGNAP